MSPNLALIADGNKFMWDGKIYETKDEPLRVKEAYQQQGFEVRMVEEGGKFLLYTRRVVKEVTVTAP